MYSDERDDYVGINGAYHLCGHGGAELILQLPIHCKVGAAHQPRCIELALQLQQPRIECQCWILLKSNL